LVAEAENADNGADSEDIAEQLRQFKAADIVVQAVTGLVTLGFLRLAGDQLDLVQARLAIDSLRALEPIVREQVSAELGDELERAIVSLQLAYAEAVSPKTEAAPSADSTAESRSSEPSPAGAPDVSE
jgi:hypothetical protein